MEKYGKSIFQLSQKDSFIFRANILTYYLFLFLCSSLYISIPGLNELKQVFFEFWSSLRIEETFREFEVFIYFVESLRNYYNVKDAPIYIIFGKVCQILFYKVLSIKLCPFYCSRISIIHFISFLFVLLILFVKINMIVILQFQSYFSITEESTLVTDINGNENYEIILKFTKTKKKLLKQVDIKLNKFFLIKKSAFSDN